MRRVVLTLAAAVLAVGLSATTASAGGLFGCGGCHGLALPKLGCGHGGGILGHHGGCGILGHHGGCGILGGGGILGHGGCNDCCQPACETECCTPCCPPGIIRCCRPCCDHAEPTPAEAESPSDG
jgi:hypothetical protein